MASYIRLNLQHLLSWLLQLCPIWSTYLHWCYNSYPLYTWLLV